MRAVPFTLLLALPLMFGAGACDLTDPFPDGDGGFDGTTGGSGGDGAGGNGGATPADECSDDDECDDGVCAPLPGQRQLRCVECRDSSFCPDDRPVCDGSLRCIPGDEGICRDDFDCPVTTALCLILSNGEVGVCVECRVDGDCSGGEPVCATTGRCVGDAAFPGCSEDDECGPGRLCDGNRRCVEQ